MHPPISTSPARHWFFAAFVLGQLHPSWDWPCTSPYAAAVMRQVGVELGRIEDLFAPHECIAQPCEAAQILYHLPARVILLQDHMVVSCIVFPLMLVFSFTTSMRAFVRSLHTSPLHPSAGFFAAFVLGQMHPLRDRPCTSPYAAAVMRRVGVELGRIEDLCQPIELARNLNF